MRLHPRLFADEVARAQVGEGLGQFFLRVHDDRAVPCNRLLDRLAGDQQETDAFLAGLHDHFIAGVEDGIYILGRGSFTESFPLFGFDLGDYERLFEEKLAIFAVVLLALWCTRLFAAMRELDLSFLK